MSDFVSEPPLTRRQMLRSMVCGSPILFPGILGQILAPKTGVRKMSIHWLQRSRISRPRQSGSSFCT